MILHDAPDVRSLLHRFQYTEWEMPDGELETGLRR